MMLSDFKKFGEISGDVAFDFISPCLGNPPGDFLTFYEDNKYLNAIIKNTKIKAVICYKEDYELFEKVNKTCLIVENPRIVFFQIQNLFSSVYDSKTVKVGKNSNISKSAILYDNVSIGENVNIGHNVIVYPGTSISDNVTISDGCIIGSEGFEVKKVKGGILRVQHLGTTNIEKNVVLKEYVTIHRGVFAWDETKIGEYSQIDAKVHISHGSKLNKRVFVGANSTILGNCIIGSNATLGAQCLISNRVNIADNSIVSLGSVVTKNTSENERVTGNFAIPHKIFIERLKSKG